MKFGARKNQNGMALVLALIWMPVLLTLFMITYRSGFTALIHFRIHRMMDSRALDILAVQGRTLEALGKINPIAQSVIQAKRMADSVVKAGVLPPPVLAAYVHARLVLIQMQRVIALKQKLLVSTCHMEVQKQLQSPLPAAYRKITGLSWKPLFPQLHIQDKPGYEGEEGAPKVLSSDFVNSQNILIRGQYIPEKFLTRWKSTEALLVPIKFFTFAKIKMENIESGWSAQLASLPARDDFRGAFPRSSN